MLQASTNSINRRPFSNRLAVIATASLPAPRCATVDAPQHSSVCIKSVSVPLLNACSVEALSALCFAPYYGRGSIDRVIADCAVLIWLEWLATPTVSASRLGWNWRWCWSWAMKWVWSPLTWRSASSSRYSGRSMYCQHGLSHLHSFSCCSSVTGYGGRCGIRCRCHRASARRACDDMSCSDKW